MAEVNPEEVLSEGCQVLLKWIESWSEPPLLHGCESKPAGTPAASLDATPASIPEHVILPNDRDSSS